MYIRSDELTMTGLEIVATAHDLEHESELDFQSRANRDAVAVEARKQGMSVKRSMIASQSIDPRYTVEGRLAGLPDKGLGNDLILTNLYVLRLQQRRI